MDQYREGKVKSTPNRGVKQDLKPFAYNRSESRVIGMTACLLHNEPTSYVSLARLIPLTGGAEAKASLKRALKLVGVDAKLCDLPMARLKFR